MLGQLLGGGQPGPPAQIQLPGQPQGGDSGDNPNFKGDLAAVKNALHKAIRDVDDPQDSAKLAKALTIVMDISASEAKESDDAMGLTAQHKFIRRQQAKKSAAPPQGMGY